MKKLTFLLLFVCSIGGYFYITPYIATYDLIDAVKSGDEGKLSDVVDFPALRGNIKNQLDVWAVKKAAEEVEDDNPFAALGQVLVSGFVNLMVDKLVTPSGIASLVQDKKISENGKSVEDKLSQGGDMEYDKFTLKYESLHRVSIDSKGTEETEQKLILTRKGFFDQWKLTNIQGISSVLDGNKNYVSKSKVSDKSDTMVPDDKKDLGVLNIEEEPIDSSKVSDKSDTVVPDDKKSLWVLNIEEDPIDSSKLVYLYLESESKRSIFRGGPVFIARCKNNTTEVYINWQERLIGFLDDGGEHEISSRIGKQKATTFNWSLSTSSKATFHPKPISYLKSMMTADKFAARTKVYSGDKTVTAVWNTTGMEDAIKPLREACGW